jgi:hypothetical protein
MTVRKSGQMPRIADAYNFQNLQHSGVTLCTAILPSLHQKVQPLPSGHSKARLSPFASDLYQIGKGKRTQMVKDKIMPA